MTVAGLGTVTHSAENPATCQRAGPTGNHLSLGSSACYQNFAA